MLGAWGSWDALRIEPGLGNATDPQLAAARTGLAFLAGIETALPDASGDAYLFSQPVMAASDMVSGTITEIAADANLVVASKAGAPEPIQRPISGQWDAPFVVDLALHSDPGSGKILLDNAAGELLLFTIDESGGNLALPYTLRGRVDMPYKEVLGIARKDNLVLVANGLGGVQVVDISRLGAPYHVGFIKPNGYARDVAVHDRFAVIAASTEGVVIADLRDPSMPIVAQVDTFGVATRLTIEGDKLYVTDMSGEGLVSQLNIIDLSDPFNPELERTV
jgi:hypothetical protein